MSMNEEMLLTTPLSIELYHDYAEKLPIIDFHNHLDVGDLINNRKFDNIAGLWLLGDPYKHRAMRILGVDEKYITGSASAREKFEKWCEIFPDLIGNPLWDWSLLELKRVFNTDVVPSAQSAAQLWEITNERLESDDCSALGFFNMFNVEYAAPCRTITESVAELEAIPNAAPSMRADGILPLTKDFINRLETASEMKISDLDAFSEAVRKRIASFDKAGCRFCDHALDNGFTYVCDDGKNEKRFLSVINGEVLCRSDEICLNSHVLRILAREYAARKWVMQLHIGAMRHTSAKKRAAFGPTGGYAGIGRCSVDDVVTLLNDLEIKGILPQTILFTLNPSDNAGLSILSGSFTESGVRGKVTQGPAWWWCDHLGGMREVLDAMSEYSLLSAFLGMTTDSRSLLSLSRHEYFRRVLCGWLGEKAHRGEITSDKELLARLVKRICYGNIKEILNRRED